MMKKTLVGSMLALSLVISQPLFGWLDNVNSGIKWTSGAAIVVAAGVAGYFKGNHAAKADLAYKQKEIEAAQKLQELESERKVRELREKQEHEYQKFVKIKQQFPRELERGQSFNLKEYVNDHCNPKEYDIRYLLYAEHARHGFEKLQEFTQTTEIQTYFKHFEAHLIQLNRDLAPEIAQQYKVKATEDYQRNKQDLDLGIDKQRLANEKRAEHAIRSLEEVAKRTEENALKTQQQLGQVHTHVTDLHGITNAISIQGNKVLELLHKLQTHSSKEHAQHAQQFDALHKENEETNNKIHKEHAQQSQQFDALHKENVETNARLNEIQKTHEELLKQTLIKRQEVNNPPPTFVAQEEILTYNPVTPTAPAPEPEIYL